MPLYDSSRGVNGQLKILDEGNFMMISIMADPSHIRRWVVGRTHVYNDHWLFTEKGKSLKNIPITVSSNDFSAGSFEVNFP